MFASSGNRLWCLAVVALLTLATPAVAQSVDPARRFHVLRTPHFLVYFHAGGAQAASEIAGLAEETWARAAREPGAVVPAVTHVVLADQSDSANGFANPIPRNTIFLYLAGPGSTDRLNPRDWFRTLFVHEFTHIVHLDRSEGWARMARRVFGRASWALPNLTLPTWHIEGLATWEESRTPGRGRRHIGDFLAITAEGARAGALEPMDRVSGGLTDWPGGSGPYAYGLGFHDYLATRFGPQTFGQLNTRTAGSLPYFGTLQFKQVYGKNLGGLWSDYLRDLESRTSARREPPGRRLTQHGFVVSGPRYVQAGRDARRSIVYSVRTPYERGAVYRLDTTTRETERLTTRVSGSTIGTSATGLLVFDEQDLQRNVAAYADLRAVDLATRSVTTLTHGARISDPDLSPDGRTIVAVQQHDDGRRRLVTLDVGRLRNGEADGGLRVLASGPRVLFNTPRWSPDGARIVVVRQEGAGSSQLVLVEPAATTAAALTLTVLTGDEDMRWATPTWTPDGRTIVAAGAPGDAPYNLYEIAATDGARRQLTDSSGGATWPDISADGGSIVFVAYGPEGYDVFEMAYPQGVRGPAAVPAARQLAAVVPDANVELESAPYRPWPTVLPSSWSPVVSATDAHLRIGAGIVGLDVLAYHAVSAAATWAATAPDVPGFDRVTPDWNAGYVYRRWRPQFFAFASRSTSFFDGEATANGLALASTTVETLFEAGVQLPVRRIRFSHAVQASAVVSSDRRTSLLAERTRNRNAARASWRFSSAQWPGYAISPERGITAGIATEFVREALGASGNATAITADARVYLPGFAANHVVAARGSGAFTRGDTNVSRVFVLGGGLANPIAGTLSSEGSSLLRGFASDTFAGRQLALVNLDYRFPIARPQRGLGAWPVFLHTIHGAIAVDAGHTWVGAFAVGQAKVSIAAELSTNVTLGYGLPLTATMGVGYGRDGSGAVSSGATFYARLGHAF